MFEYFFLSLCGHQKQNKIKIRVQAHGNQNPNYLMLQQGQLSSPYLLLSLLAETEIGPLMGHEPTDSRLEGVPSASLIMEKEERQESELNGFANIAKTAMC